MQKQITKCILRIMKMRGVTQSVLATSLNCSQTAVSNILNGRARLTVDDLSKISSTLQITVDEIISEAVQSARNPVNLSHEAEAQIIENKLTFYILNKLKIPTKLRELLNEFEPDKKKEVEMQIKNLKKLDVISEDISGKLKLNFDESSILHYRLTEEYSNRISEIYADLRPIVNEVAKSSKLTAEWKQKNVDSFYVEFFTAEQIKQQNIMMREFLDLIKHHIRMNRYSSQKSDLMESSELRVVFVSSAPYPKTKFKREENG